MKVADVTEKLSIPEGIQVSIAGRMLTVKGPKGEISRKFIEPSISITVEADTITFKIKEYTKKEKTLLGTYKAHIKNMFRGVTEGHEYTLKICSGHFPMTVDYKNNVFSVKNYLGEKVPRKLTFDKDVAITVEGEKVTVSGIDKELISQSAARIEQLTKRSKFDRRVFQDGIYIVNKDGKAIE